MPIRFGCRCGKQLVAPESRGGSRARCPACGAVVEVPGSETDDLPEPLLIEPTKTERRPDAVPGEKRARRKRSPSQPDGESTFRKAAGRGEPRAVPRKSTRLRGSSASYGDDLKATLLFPGNLNNLITFAIIWLILCVKEIFLPYAFIFGWLGSLIIYGWFCGYRFSIIAAAASGDEELPRFEVDEFFLSVVRWWGTWIIALMPAVFCAVALVGAQAPEWFDGVLNEESERWYLRGPIIPVAAMFFAGLFVWPMFALCVTMGGFSTLVRMDLILRTIFQSLPVYLFTVVVVFAALFVFKILGAVQNTFGLIGIVPMIGVGLYLQIVAMRMIGLYYHHFKHRFAWSWG